MWSLESRLPSNAGFFRTLNPSAGTVLETLSLTQCHTLKSRTGLGLSVLLLAHIGFISANLFYIFFQIVRSLRATLLESINAPVTSWLQHMRKIHREEESSLYLPHLGWDIRAQRSSTRSAQRSVSDHSASHHSGLLLT